MLRNFTDKVLHSPRKLYQFIIYKLSEMRNYYPCRAVGQRTTAPGRTVILYTIFGKRDLYEICINELIVDKELVNKFPPIQAMSFGAIALGDSLCDLPEIDRLKKIEEVKEISLGDKL